MAIVGKGLQEVQVQEAEEAIQLFRRSLASLEKRKRWTPRLGSWTSPRSGAITVMGWGTLLLNARRQRKHQEISLITGNKDWMDSYSEDEEVSYALMANADEPKASTSEKVHTTNYNCDLNSVSELRCFLNSLNTSFRSQSLENSRLINEADELRKKK